MTQNTLAPQWKSLVGCLGRRVLTVALLLLVAPLLVHTFLLYKEAQRAAITDNLNNLSLLARSEASFLRQYIKQTIADLKTVELLGDYAEASIEQPQQSQFSQIAVAESLSSFFLAEKQSDNSWKILAAAHPERLTHKDLNAQQYNNVLDQQTSAYLFDDPISQKKEMRVGYAISDKRIMIAGIELDSLSAQLVRAPSFKSTPIAAFSTDDSDLYFASNPTFDLASCLLFSQEELIDISYQPIGNFLLPENDQFVGVKIPVMGNSFYLIIALTRSQFYDISSVVNLNHLIQLTLLFLVIGGGGVFFLTTRIARPLKQLFACIDQVGTGDLKVRYSPDPVGFELNMLGQKFNQMLTSLEHNIQEAKKQKLAKELLKQEFGIGQDIQRSIMKTSLKDYKNFDFAYAFTPAMEVSGDFFDVYKIDEDHVLFSIADTAGKGISACLYSLGARSCLRALVKSSQDLGDVLTRFNDLFNDDAENQGTFITAFVGILKVSTSKLEYCSCGHPPAFLIKDTSLEMLSTGSMALGVDKSITFASKTITLDVGDKVLLYTDGVIEATNKESTMYSMDRLKNFLESQKMHSAQVIVHDLQKDVEVFSDQTELHDDITILCLEKRKASLPE